MKLLVSHPKCTVTHIYTPNMATRDSKKRTPLNYWRLQLDGCQCSQTTRKVPQYPTEPQDNNNLGYRCRFALHTLALSSQSSWRRSSHHKQIARRCSEAESKKSEARPRNRARCHCLLHHIRYIFPWIIFLQCICWIFFRDISPTFTFGGTVDCSCPHMSLCLAEVR